MEFLLKFNFVIISAKFFIIPFLITVPPFLLSEGAILFFNINVLRFKGIRSRKAFNIRGIKNISFLILIVL